MRVWLWWLVHNLSEGHVHADGVDMYDYVKLQYPRDPRDASLLLQVAEVSFLIGI